MSVRVRSASMCIFRWGLWTLRIVRLMGRVLVVTSKSFASQIEDSKGTYRTGLMSDVVDG